jgi:hypothetical protein
MEEVYKAIDGYNIYEVSNMGNVRNKKTGLILKQKLRKGYYSIGLSKNGKNKNFNIHRLIASYFIPNPNNKRCVDHIDRDKLNNKIENLRWVSISENGMNRTISTNNKSSYSGVCFHKKIKKWQVKITINGKGKYIGIYTNFEDAVIARKEQENIHYKEFQAFQNEIDRLEFEFQQAIK